MYFVNSILFVRNVFIGLSIVFCILQICLLFFVPESPKYLLIKKKNALEAENGLKRTFIYELYLRSNSLPISALRKLRHVFNVEAEISEMQEEARTETQAVS